VLAQKSFVILLSRVFGAVLGLVGLFFITRYLGPEVYGTVSWAMAFVALFNTFAELGISTAHVKRISEGKNLEDCIATYTAIKLLLIGVMLALILSYIIGLSLLGYGMSWASIEVVLLFIAYYIFYDLANIVWTTYEARLESIKNQLIILADPLVRIPLIVIISLYGLGALEIAFAYAIGGSAMVVIGLFFFARDKVHWKHPTLYRSYIKFAIPVTFITIFGSVSWNLDKIMIGAFDSNTSVGFFSSSQTLLGVLGFLGGAVSAVTFPAFSKMISEGRMHDVMEMTRLSERYISILGLPLILATIVAPTQIAVTILGQDFAQAGVALRYLAVATFAQMLREAYVPQIIAMDKPAIIARMSGVLLIVNFALLLLFIPSQLAGVPLLGLGFEGAAIVNVIISVAALVYIIFVAYGLTGTTPNPRLLLHMVAAGLTAIVLTATLSIWTIQQWYDLVMFGFYTVVVFAVFLALFRELTKADIKYLFSIISPRLFAGYIADEMKQKKK